MKRKKGTVMRIANLVVVLILSLNTHGYSEERSVSEYTCGMHPDIRVSVEDFKKGDTQCPVCFMPLTPVVKNAGETGSLDPGVISRVEIKAKELQLAGIKTERVRRRSLFKEIRAVGRVAYDPELAIAQDEFISAIKSRAKAEQGQIPEITARSQSLIESSKRRLLLLAQ